MDKVLNRIALVAAIFTLFLNQTLAGGHIGWLIASWKNSATICIQDYRITEVGSVIPILSLTRPV